MKIAALIQVRTGSTRLKDKTFVELEGKPLLWHIIDRVKKAKHIKEIVIATTSCKGDDRIEEFAKKDNIRIFRGSENNVLDRFYQAAKKFEVDVIIRVTADDPFKDPKVIDKAIDIFLKEDYDYVSNTIKPTYPEGIDIEVFSFKALEKAWKEADKTSEKEHVTPYIWKNPNLFNTFNFEYKEDLSNLRWTIDYEEDYQFAKEVYKRLYKEGEIFYMEDILELLEKEPGLAKINQGIVRNEGYFKSIKEDKKMKKIERISKKEEDYVKDVLNTQFRSSKGAMMMTRFEQEFAKKYNVKFAISHINGTATLHSCLAAAGIGPGDEVIVPPLTMSSTSFAVIQQNAVAIFADIDPDTFVIDAKYIKPLITERTKAIITVALYGLSPDMDPIMDLAKKNNLVVIEDNAQAFLSYYKGKLAGTIGHMSSFSFQSSKHITAGEGGIVLTDDEKLALAVRRFSSLGYAGVGAGKGKITKKDIQNPNYERHVQMGYNYRMPELCAAVALAQTERMDELVKRRAEVAKLFDSVIKEKKCSWLIPQKIPDYAESSFWTYVVRLEHPNVKWEDFQKKFLELGGDGFYAAWKLIYQEPMFKTFSFNFVEKVYDKLYKGKLQDYSSSLCPNAEALQKKLIQFKTNFWDWKDAERNAEVLRKTIDFFDKRE